MANLQQKTKGSVNAQPRTRKPGIGLAASLLCLALGSGCITTTFKWVKPGAESEPAESQLASCTLDAERSAVYQESAEARAARVRHWTDLCMRASGWHKQEESIE